MTAFTRAKVGGDRYPGLWQASALLALAFVAQVVVTIPVAALAILLDRSLLSRIQNDPTALHPGYLAVVNLVSLGLVIAYGTWRTGAPPREVLPLRRVRPALFIPTALTVLGVSIIASEANNLLTRVWPIPQFLAELLTNLATAKKGLWASVLALVVVAPLTEELLFRGVMLRGFLRRYSVPRAILWSSLLFAVAHGNPWQAPGALLGGILFGWWFVRTRSLVPCLFGHALNNALPLILSAGLGVKIRGYTDQAIGHAPLQPAWLDATGIALAVGGIWMVTRLLARGTQDGAGVPLTRRSDPYRPLAGHLPVLEALLGWGMGRVRRRVLRLLREHQARHVLDAACGTGWLARSIADAGMAPVGVDASATMLRRAAEKASLRPRFPVVLADAQRLPFSRAFDGAVITLALHEMEPELRRQVWAEMARVVVPGGLLLVADFAVPASTGPWARLWRAFFRFDEAQMLRIYPAHFCNYVAFMDEGGVTAWVQGQGTQVVGEWRYYGGNLALVAVRCE